MLTVNKRNKLGEGRTEKKCSVKIFFLKFLFFYYIVKFKVIVLIFFDLKLKGTQKLYLKNANQ